MLLGSPLELRSFFRPALEDVFNRDKIGRIGGTNVELWIYVILFVLMFLVSFCCVFFPVRKNHLFGKVEKISYRIQKIKELNESFSGIDVSYSHHIQEKVMVKSIKAVDLFQPDIHFEKNVDALHGIYGRQKRNQAAYHLYAKAYQDILNSNDDTSDDVLKKNHLSRKEFQKLEARLLSSFFLAVYDKEDVFYSVYACHRMDDGKLFCGKIYLYPAKDIFEGKSEENRTDEKKETTSDESINDMNHEVKEEEKEASKEGVPTAGGVLFDGIEYSIDGDKAMPMKVIEEKDELRIPSSVTKDGRKYQVKEIEEGVFSSLSMVKCIVLEEGIEKIGRKAFHDSASLVSVFLPASVKIIEEKAFSGCRRLKSVYLPLHVEKVGNEAFALCLDLETVSMSGHIKEVGRSLFWLDANVKIHIRDIHPSWKEGWNTDHNMVIYDE